jgi:hypothetical protein
MISACATYARLGQVYREVEMPKETPDPSRLLSKGKGPAAVLCLDERQNRAEYTTAYPVPGVAAYGAHHELVGNLKEKG